MSIVPYSEFCLKQDENEGLWLVRKKNGAAFASQTALAWMCEVSQPAIANITGQGDKCPKAMMGLNLSDITTIENPTAGRCIEAIPANACHEILFYFSYEARGHEKRLRAKDLCKRMGKAGASVFIYGMAGYKVSATEEKVKEQVKFAVTPEERISMAVSCLEKIGVDLNNPRIKQGMHDYALNLLGVAPVLPKLNGDVWCGVAERAEQLGFGRVGANLSLRSRLGAFVSKNYPEIERTKEERLCNGTNQKIWIYRVTEQLDCAIKSFFGGIEGC